MEAEYNDIQPWDFKLLPAVFRAAPNTARTYAVQTRAELNMLLDDLSFGPPLRIVELNMDKYDAPESLQGTIDSIHKN